MEDSEKSLELAVSGELPDASEEKKDVEATETAETTQENLLATSTDTPAEHDAEDVEMNEENDEMMDDPENNNVEPDTLGPPEELMEGEDHSGEGEGVESSEGFAAAFAASDSTNNFLTHADHLTVQSELPQQLMEEADGPESADADAAADNVAESTSATAVDGESALAEAGVQEAAEEAHDDSQPGEAAFAVEGHDAVLAEEDAVPEGGLVAVEAADGDAQEKVSDDNKQNTLADALAESGVTGETGEGKLEEGVDVAMADLASADQLTADQLLEADASKLALVGDGQVADEAKTDAKGGEMASDGLALPEDAPDAEQPATLMLAEGQLVGDVSALGNLDSAVGEVEGQVADGHVADSNGAATTNDLAALANTLADSGQRLSTAQRFDLSGARQLGDLAGLRLMAEDDGAPEDESPESESAARVAQLDIVKNEIKAERPDSPGGTAAATATEAEADALATLASAALGQQAPTNGIKSEIKLEDPSRSEQQWNDVGICKGTSCTVRSYLVPRSGQNWNEGWEDITTDNMPDHSMFHKIDIGPGQAYKFRVAAINSCGRGPWSEVRKRY